MDWWLSRLPVSTQDDYIDGGIIQALVCSAFLILAGFSYVSATVQPAFIIHSGLIPTFLPKSTSAHPTKGPMPRSLLSGELQQKSAWKEMLFCNCFRPWRSCCRLVPTTSYWCLYKCDCWESLSSERQLSGKKAARKPFACRPTCFF